VFQSFADTLPKKIKVADGPSYSCYCATACLRREWYLPKNIHAVHIRYSSCNRNRLDLGIGSGVLVIRWIDNDTSRYTHCRCLWQKKRERSHWSPFKKSYWQTWPKNWVFVYPCTNATTYVHIRSFTNAKCMYITFSKWWIISKSRKIKDSFPSLGPILNTVFVREWKPKFLILIE
jgi:hypothetical protein